MSEKLRMLPGAQKKAVVALACMVEAQGKEGRFRTDDPEVGTIVRECFGPDWAGRWDDDYRNRYLADAVTQDADRCLETVSALDMETKYAFKNLLIDIVGDDAMTMLAAAYVLKGIGMEAAPDSPAPGPAKERRNTQEDDGTYVVKDAFYARLSDVNAIRAEGSTEVFTMKHSADDPGVRCGTDYDAWKGAGVCPANGVIGYVNPAKGRVTSEGTLYYLVCETDLVVPVLDWGLEKIDQWQYASKRQNNRVLMYDKSGKHCEALRAMKKSSRREPETKPAADPSKTVVHFEAHVQEKYISGQQIDPNYIIRHITLTYTAHGSRLELEVLGVMRPRHARFENDDGRVIRYRDMNNPVVYYEVETDPRDNTIVRVSIIQLNEDYETVEYRYTV